MIRIFLRILNTPLLILIVLVGIAIEGSLFSSYFLSWLKPNIALCAVIWCAFERHLELGGVITLILAYCCHVTSSAPMGLYFVSLMSVYLLVRLGSRFLVMRSRFSYSFVAVISCFGFYFLNYLELFILRLNLPPLVFFLPSVCFFSVVNGIFSLWFYKVFHKLDEITLTDMINESSFNNDD